ncbi:MAG: radical SAM protein [Hyphomicrobiales bacterium]|nr:radical SAM protein [Hyphomicrobiales bacterium]
MNQQPRDIRAEFRLLDPDKFIDPNLTANGEARASVALDVLDTLWINTGTLCNITCAHCYIESSPTNDRLAYFAHSDAVALFDEIAGLDLKTREIGFTGGEPFMNRDIIAMLDDALDRGFDVLVLTNAMQPMLRPRIKQGLLDLNARHPGKLSLRVSVDHYTQVLHEAERGPGSWAKTIEGLDWLSENGFKIAIAGRTCWGEFEDSERAGYANLIETHGWAIDPADPMQLVLFPEMNERIDVPEITTECWSILGKRPSDVMCASSRMAVKRKGEDKPSILPCTLLPYDDGFEMGSTLAEMLKADGGNFADGAVKLNHPHCAKFCVLGGGSCSRAE